MGKFSTFTSVLVTSASGVCMFAAGFLVDWENPEHILLEGILFCLWGILIEVQGD